MESFSATAQAYLLGKGHFITRSPPVYFAE